MQWRKNDTPLASLLPELPSFSFVFDNARTIAKPAVFAVQFLQWPISIMINSREQLIHVLTEAAEVEHNLLCSYLYAAFSIKRASEFPGPHGGSVDGWRKVILSVAVEEMAHLACVNNLLLAIGGSAHFDRPNLPVARGYHPASITVRLTPFDAATLDHFIFLERPDDASITDGAGFVRRTEAREERVHSLTPSAIDYDTIGELYDGVAKGFETLALRLGERNLIDPTGCGQLEGQQAGLPNVSRITKLDDALSVIEQIKEQGEGSSGSAENSHFDRFQEIKREWAQFRSSAPAFAPAWPAAHDPVMRRPAEGSNHVWITDELSSAYLDVGNAAYGAMLSVMCQVFGCDAPKRQVALMGASVELMKVLGTVGNALARMPAGEAWPGVNAGLSFTVPRNLGFRARASKSQMLERVEEMRVSAAELLRGAVSDEAQRGFHASAKALASYSD